MKNESKVVGFSYKMSTIDGCVLTSRYQVSGEAIEEIPHGPWQPTTPHLGVDDATLTTHYASGKQLTVELNGDEHILLVDSGKFDKLLSSIVSGNMPGEALKRQLTKVFDLPKLPKLKKPKFT